MPEYTRPALVTGTRTAPRPQHGQAVTGYGGEIPTRHMIRYLGVWRRVYTMIYGNSGTPYVNVKGVRLLIDTDTAHRLAHDTESE